MAIYEEISGYHNSQDIPTPWVMGYQEELLERLICEVETDEDREDRKKEKRLKEYDRGVDGFVDFCRECLTVYDKESGRRLPMTIWSKQREVVQSVLDNRRTAVVSGHSLGKSYLAAALCLWWFCCRGLNFYTTAPKLEHVKSVIWKNIKILYEGRTRELPGRWHPLPRISVKGNAGWHALGYSLGDSSEGAQGFHDEEQLIVGDEAAGLDEKAYASFRSSMASEGTRLLLIGNGKKGSDSEFRQSFMDPLITGRYNTISISCWDSPNITGECYIPGIVTREWCEEQQAMLEHSDPDEYKCKVLGEWPDDDSEAKMIPNTHILGAMDLWDVLEEEEKDYLHPPSISKAYVDVAAEGKDKSALVSLRGQRVFVEKWWRGGGEAVTMSVADDVATWIRELPWDQKPEWLGVDYDAIGKGVADRLIQLKWENPDWFGRCHIVKDKGSEAATDKTKFNNITTELWWRLREVTDPTRPYHERLAIPSVGPSGLSRNDIIGQLSSRGYETDDLGRRKVESKKQLKRRGCPSPDVADAIAGLMMRPNISVEGFFA